MIWNTPTTSSSWIRQQSSLTRLAGIGTWTVLPFQKIWLSYHICDCPRCCPSPSRDARNGSTGEVWDEFGSSPGCSLWRSGPGGFRSVSLSGFQTSAAAGVWGLQRMFTTSKQRETISMLTWQIIKRPANTLDPVNYLMSFVRIFLQIKFPNKCPFFLPLQVSFLVQLSPRWQASKRSVSFLPCPDADL